MSDVKNIQSVINYWNSRPCNIKHSSAEVGTKQYFEEVEQRKYFVEPHIPKFADFSKWVNKSVLEIGCGIGTDAINFAKAGAFYTGIEISSESLEIAKKRFEVYGLEGILLEADAEILDKYFNNKTFDLIYSFGVLHHTPSISNAFKSIRTLCHKDTEFNFMVYAENSWKNAMIKAGLDQPEAQFGCPIANTYSKEEISQLLHKHGFEVITIEQDHIFPFNVSKYVQYEYEYEPWFKEMSEQMFNALQKELGWHLLISAKPI